MKKSVSDISSEIKKTVREEHPKALQHMQLILIIKAQNLSDSDAKEALKVTENEMCPIWAMIKGNAAVNIEIENCT